MSSTNWWNHSITNLRDELRNRGLETYGQKPQMVRRLQSYEENYKRRMDALKAKQSSAYKSTPGDYKVVDEWKSDDNKGDKKDSKVPEKKDDQKANGEKPPNYWGMTMSELRKISESNSLSTMGSKYDIIERLKTYDDYQRKKEKDSHNSGSSTPQKAQSSDKSSSSADKAKSPMPPPATVKTPASTPTAKTTTGTTTPKATTPTAKPATPSTPVAKPTASVTPSPTGKATTTPAPAKSSPATSTSKPGTPASKPTTPQSTPAAAKTPTPAASPATPSNEKKYASMTFAQLKIECVNRKINIQGSKPEIIQRLLEHDKKKAPTTPQATTLAKPATTPTQVKSTPTATPATVKLATAWKSIQAAPVTMARCLQSDLISVDEPRPQELRNHFLSESVPYSSGNRRKMWSNTKIFPDLTKDILPDMEWDRNQKSLIIYPLSFTDLLNPVVAKWRNSSRDFSIHFRQPTVTKSLKGSLELRLFTRNQVTTAMKELRDWNKDLKVEKIPRNQTADDILKKIEASPKNLEPQVNRMLFLNKIAPNVKEGNLTVKFADAASVVIARETDGSSKGYGYVEYLSREAAEAAMKKVTPLEVDRQRVDVMLFNKVPSAISDKMMALVMSDVDRIKMAESYNSSLQQRNKNIGYAKNQARDDSLNKQIEKMEKDLALDAAIRKKLGYEQLPEPAAHQTADQRKEWQSGSFKGVDLGTVKEIWADPKDAEAASKAAKEAALKREQEAKAATSKSEGPPPAKQSRYDSSVTQRDSRPGSRDSSRDTRDSRDSSRGRSGRDQDSGRFSQQGKSRDDDLKRKEPYNSRQNTSTSQSSFTSPSLLRNNPNQKPFQQTNAPSLLSRDPTSRDNNQRGGFNKPAFSNTAPGGGSQPRGLMGEPKSLMGDYNAPGAARPGMGRGGLLGRPDSKPSLLGQAGSPFMRNQPGGEGSPMDLEDSGSDKFGRQDDFRNQSRFESGGQSRFGNQGNKAPGLLGDPMESSRFGGRQDDKKVPSLFDAGSGRDSGSFGSGQNKPDDFNKGGRGETFLTPRGGMGRGTPGAGGVPSLLDSAPGQRSSFSDRDTGSFTMERDDPYGNKTDSQFGAQRGRAQQSSFGQRSDPYGQKQEGDSLLGSYGRGRGGQNQPFDSQQTGGFGRGREGRQNESFDTGRDSSSFGRGRGAGRPNEPYAQTRPLLGRKDMSAAGSNDPYSRDTMIRSGLDTQSGASAIGSDRFGAGARLSRFDEQDNTGSMSQGNQQYGSQYGDSGYEDPMDQPLQFRRTPGAKDQGKSGFGPGNRFQQGQSQGDAYRQNPYGGRYGSQKYGDESHDQYGDQQPWTEDYGDQQESSYGNKSSLGATAAKGRGLAATLNQLLPKLSGPGDQSRNTVSSMGGDRYGTASTDPYGLAAKPTDATQRRSRFDQTPKPDNSTKHDIDYAALSATMSQHTGASQYDTSKPPPTSRTSDEDYYQQGMAAKYGRDESAQDAYGRDPYSQSGYGSQASTGAHPWQKQSGSSWAAGGDVGNLPSGVEDVSIDLLKDISSKVSALKTQMKSENIPTDSHQAALTGQGGSTRSTSTYKSGPVSYGDSRAPAPPGYGQTQYGAPAADPYAAAQSQPAYAGGYGQQAGQYGQYQRY